MRNLAPSNSIIAFIEAHFDPGKVTPKVVLKDCLLKKVSQMITKNELCSLRLFFYFFFVCAHAVCIILVADSVTKIIKLLKLCCKISTEHNMDTVIPDLV